MPDRAAEPRVGDAGPASPDPRAQELYERARYLSYRRGNGDLELARRYFHQSVTFDPNFAQAWAGLAGVYWIETVEARLPEQQGLAQLRAAAERALALDPGLAEAHLRLANYHWRAGDRTAGDGHLRRAVALEPDNALVLSFVASISAGDGRLDEAIAQMRRAVEVEPLASLYRYNLASYLYLAGHGEEALAELDKLLELAPASRDRDMDLVGLALILAGRFDEALLVSADLQDESSRLQVRALALYGSGRAAEADAALESLAWAAREQGAYRVAEVYAYRGETDRAFTWLQRANDESGSRRSSTRKPQPLAVEYSPLLKPLHTDPRWRAWLDS
jgi:tetratricopeptide (TPR) repeat protein